MLKNFNNFLNHLLFYFVLFNFAPLKQSSNNNKKSR